MTPRWHLLTPFSRLVTVIKWARWRKHLFTAPFQLVGGLRDSVIPECLDRLRRRVCGDEDVLVRRLDEALSSRIIEPLENTIPEAFDVEQADTLGVNAKLVPSRSLEDLLHGTEPAAQTNEAASWCAGNDLLGHELLAGVHVLHSGGAAVDAFLGDRPTLLHLICAVTLILDQGFGDDSVD